MLFGDFFLSFFHAGISVFVKNQSVMPLRILVGHKSLQYRAFLNLIPYLGISRLPVGRRLSFGRGIVSGFYKGDDFDHAIGNVGLPVKGDVRMVKVGDAEDADASSSARQSQSFRSFSSHSHVILGYAHRR